VLQSFLVQRMHACKVWRGQLDVDAGALVV